MYIARATMFKGTVFVSRGKETKQPTRETSPAPAPTNVWPGPSWVASPGVRSV